MKREKGFGTYLSKNKETELILQNKVRLRKFVGECCQDYQESEAAGKIEILKDILLLLMKMVFGDNEVQIQFGQGYNNDSCVDTEQTITENRGSKKVIENNLKK